MATTHVSRKTPTPGTVAAATGHRQPYDQELPLNDTKETPAVTSAATNETAPAAKREPKASAVKLEDVKFGAITTAKPDTFARSSRAIPEDHPLLKAFRMSYDKKEGIDVETPDPDALTKIIRRIAAQEGKGVSVKRPRDGVVSFFAQDRKKVVRKKPDADSAATGK